MKLIKTILLLAATMVVFVADADTGSIKGKITDANTGKPLEGASVIVVGTDGDGVTDVFGNYIIRNLKAGTYAFVVSKVGYQQLQNRIVIEDGVTTEFHQSLIRSFVEMKEVSVNAKKDLSTSFISALDMKLRPVNTTQDMLRLVPGLFTAQHQGGGKAEQIFLRGFDCDHGTDILISVDDIPVNMVSHAHGQGFSDTHFIIPESVQQIDYSKGPYQIDKGNFCTAGYVSCKTKNFLDNNFIKIDGGSFDYFRAVGGINLLNTRQDSNHHQDAFLIGEYGYNRSFFTLPQNFNRFNIFGKCSNYLSNNKILTLTMSGFHSFWNASGQIPTRAVTDGIVGRFGNLDAEAGITSRYNLNLQYLQQIGENAYFKSNVYYSYYQFKLYSDFTYFLVDSINGDQIRQSETRSIYGYNSDYHTSYVMLHLKMKTQIGVGFRHDDIINDELAHTMAKSITLGEIELGDVHETNIFGYVNQAVYIFPRLVLNAGSRFDALIQGYKNELITNKQSTTFYNNSFSPKATICYNFRDNARIYCNYGVGFHSNDTRTLALGIQNGIPVTTSYAMPRAFSQELGFVGKPYKQLLLSAALWHLDLQQEFTYDGDEASVQPAGRTRRYGIDLSGRCQLAGWLYIDADLNWSHGRFIDSSTDHNYIPLAPTLTSIGGITILPAKAMSASLRYRHMNNRPADETNTLTANGYTVFDAVFNYTASNFEWGVQIQNVFNVSWNEAQFATETRIRMANGQLEPFSRTDVCFTPGTPFFLKLSATYKF